MMGRTIVIGDIHGALRALTALIDRIGLANGDDLVFLGDYVDGWSESAAVIEYLMDLGAKYPCVFLKGNHDAWCEAWLAGASPDINWLLHGGVETLESYASLSKTRRKAHLGWFQQLKLYHTDGRDRLFVHAGFSSMHGPEGEHFAATLFWDRSLWEMALALDDRLSPGSPRFPKRLGLYSEIFIGHTPTTNYDVTVPMQARNVWNIDTGAAFLGRLSAMDIGTKEYWQSEVVQTLYPGEKGRNK